MKRSWKDLGEVWSGRDLAVGEVVTLNVFDKASNTLLEQINYAAPDDRRAQYTWVQDFCRYINAQSALVHAGTENTSGDWEILNSGYRNHYWNLTSRELLVTTTAPSAWNWNSQRAIPLHATHSLPIGTRMRLNVRSANDILLETFSFELDWFGMHQWPRDLAQQINASSRLVRAGCANGERIVPETGATESAIWLPYNGNFKVSWFAETVSVDAEDDAGQGAQQPLLVFDYNADRLVEGAVVQQDVAAAERCKAYVLDDASEEVLDETEVVPTQDLKAKDRVKVNISTRAQGRVCETLTFTPVANRLKAGQWHHDLALQINAQSRCIKAWAEDEAVAKGNIFWLPIWPSQELQVGMQVIASSAAQPTAVEQKKDEVPASVGSDKCSVLWPCEPGRRAFTTAMSANNWVKGPALDSADIGVSEQIVLRVKGSKTGRILESLVFLPKSDRLGLRAWTEDLCSQVNDQCRFLRAGECNANTFVIAASGSKAGNFFWTPAGSGLVVEAEILSGFTFAGRGRLPTSSADAEEELPGMIAEDRRLFDQYAESGRLISIDALSGLPTLNIPVADLYADDSLSQPLKVSLSFDSGVFLTFGGATRYLAMPQGKFSNEFILCLRDGRKVKVEIGMEANINGGDFTVSSIREKYSGEMQCVGFKVTYKDGGSDDFRLVSRTDKGGVLPLSRYSISSGSELKIAKSSVDEAKVELKVTKNSEALLEAKLIKLVGTGVKVEAEGLLEQVVVYPKSTIEKVTWSISRPDELTTTIEADGLGTNGKVVYCIGTDSSNRLLSVEMKQQHSFTEGEKTKTDEAIRKETLEYDDKGKVKLLEISPGGDMDDLVHEYTYSDTGSVLTGFFKAATPKTVFTRTLSFSDGQSSEDTYGSSTMPVSRTQSSTLDETNRCVVTSTKVCEGDVTVDKQTLTVDALGNPLSRGENDRTTHYTYYNNYQQYNVKKTEEKVHNTSFFGWLLKSLDYINPVGWACLVGGKGGFSWGTYLKTSVEMKPAKNAYAQKAFDLPVEIVHCGSDKPFSGDVESELVTRKVSDEEVAHSLSYFGYAMVNDRVMLTKKLTVLQPNYTKEDVADLQLKVAEAAADELIKSLKDEIKNASKETKPAFASALEELNKSLKAQSEVNREGYKLGKKKSASMSVETYDYHVKSDEPGYGTMKSIVRVLLDENGKEVEASRRTTKMEYSVDTATKRLVIKTTVTGSDKVEVVSSQTRSRHTGRLYESTDSEGIKTVYTYDPQGNMTSETVSEGDKQRSKTTATPVRKLGWLFELVEGDISSRVEKDALGRKVTMWLKPKDATDFLETQRWTYDSCGRTLTSVEIDYGAENKKISQRQTSWSYDSTSGKLSIENVLKTGGGTWIKRTKQSVTPGAKGELFTQGNFSIDRQFDPATNILTEHYATTDSDGCKIKRSMTADGLMKSISYVKVDKEKKESEVDKISFEHDKYGQMKKVTPKLGAASSYEYDSAGRLLKTTRDGLKLVNQYDESTLVPVSKSSRAELVKPDTAVPPAFALGAQTVDMLGRVTSQTSGLGKTEFSYVGGSTVSALKSLPKVPTALAGYSGNLDQASRTRTQTIKTGDVEQTSKLVFSTGGRVLSSTDLTGEVTTYTYDFFNRVVGSKNDHCETTFDFADNGLLTSESVKAVKVDMTMKVTYAYDALGQETGRTFTCEGLDTFALTRELLADGRVEAASCKQGDGEESRDQYEYDESLRLTGWFGSNGGSEFDYDYMGNMINGAGYRFSYAYMGKEIYRSPYEELNSGAFLVITDMHTAVGEFTPLEGKATCDNAGRLTAVGDIRVSYHDNGQLKTWSTDADKTRYTFSYDSDGRVRGGSTGTRTDTFHYRGDCVYALVQSDSDESASFSTRTLVLRNDSRACLMQDALVDGDDSKTTRSFELRDAAGTVFASIDLKSKSVTLFRYTPYGKRTDGVKATTWLGFKGEPLMGSTGLYYLGNGYRAYNPEWGRFLGPDNQSPFGVGGANAYAFGANDPVNHCDPSGHQIVAQYERWSTAPIMESTAFRVAVNALSVVIAPFTAGMSALLAVATTALAVVSFSFEVASTILAESDPELARTLETWGQAFGIAGAAAGVAMMVHGWSGIPRSWFKVRGQVPARGAGFIRKPPSELLAAQLARARRVDAFVRVVNEVKAAGTFKAFKASYLPPEPMMSGGASVATSSGASLGARLNRSAKNLFTGVIREVDDSLWDALGTVLDMQSGPSTVIAKFQAPLPGETGLVSIVGGPFPGREKLFP